MPTPAVKFNRQDSPEFHKVLNQRVQAYFKEKSISKHADLNMRIKTVFMVSLYLLPLFAMLLGLVHTTWVAMTMWVLMGLGMSGIGLAVMHDANHGSYSQNPKVNKALGYILNLVGGYHVNWKIQHNVLHHSFTNVEGHDEDIETLIMRQAPGQERKYLHRFQAFYAPFFYGLMTIYWFLSKDYEQLVRYNRMGLLKGQGLTYKQALREVLINKSLYIVLTLVLPILIVDIPWWHTLLGFLMMQYISGLILALVFQPAHVIEETEFYIPDEQGSVENNWAIHQLKTTANYSRGSRLFSWYIGGLNYQIEHHLFPTVCHVHYRNIAPIVKSTAEEFGIPYYEHKTFVSALASHFSLLHRLGTGKYDKELKLAA